MSTEVVTGDDQSTTGSDLHQASILRVGGDVFTKEGVSVHRMHERIESAGRGALRSR